MKVFLKNLSKKSNLLLIAVFILAAVLRFYNFPSRITFWSEQARSLIVSAKYIKEKPSLLGQEYFRQDSNAHTIYSGAIFNYSLVPLLLVSDYNPVIITAFFSLLNLFTGLAIYFVIKKIFSPNLALFSVIFFLFNDYMIYHSLFIWNYNFLPLVGILIFYFTWLHLKDKKNKRLNLFLAGFTGGIGVSLQFLFAPIALFFLIFNLLRGKENKFLSVFIFLSGMALGNLPMILFDIRHDFYNSLTLLQYLFDTLAGKSDAGFSYYYLLPFWPTFAVVLAFITIKLSKINKFLTIFILLPYLYLNLASPRSSFVSSYGMPEGLTISDIDKASELIAKDANSEFNVAEVLDFDKRAYVLRYFVEYKYGKKPLGETQYQNLNLLYVLSQKDYNFGTSDVWEIRAGGKYNQSKISDIGKGYAVYKLSK